MVGIVVPTYNSSAFLRQCIRSIQEQTFKQWRLVVTDDSSTDESVSVAHEFAQDDPRIRIYVSEKNAGAHANFNRGIALLPDCNYICVLPADDWWELEFLEQAVSALVQNPEIAFVHSDARRVFEGGEDQKTYVGLCDHRPTPGAHKAMAELFENDYVPPMGTMLNMPVISAIRGQAPLFDPSLKYTADYFLWLSLMVLGASAYYIPRTLATFRKHDGQHTHVKNLLERRREEVLIFGEMLATYENGSEEIEKLRRGALEKRLTYLAFDELEQGSPHEALKHLAALLELSDRRRIDGMVAYVICRSPFSSKLKATTWKMCRRAYNSRLFK